MKRFTIILVLTVMVLVTVMPSFAAGPDKVPFDYEVDYPLVDNCQDYGFSEYSIWNHEVGEGIDRFYYDQEGNLIKWSWHANGLDTLYVQGYPDKVAKGKFGINVTLYFVPPNDVEPVQERHRGNAWNIHLPGHGNVFRLAGTAVFDEEGNLDKLAGLEVEDFVALCEYFEH